MSKRILLVATEGEVIRSIPATLRLAGHRVDLAACGLEGIKQARDSSPDLILVDAELPDMDGSTLVDILRRLPSTSDLRTTLFKPRKPLVSSMSDAERDIFVSGELLGEVGRVLTACMETIPPEAESEDSKVDYA